MKLSAQLNKELNSFFTEETGLKMELRRLVQGNKKQRQRSRTAKQAQK